MTGGYVYLLSPSQYTAQDSSHGIRLQWTNPVKYTDGLPIHDLAYILVYRDDKLFDSLEQTHLDTGQIRTYFDPVEGYHKYNLQALDGDTPPHSSPITNPVVGYGGEPSSELCAGFETGKGLIYTTGMWDTTGSLSSGGRFSFTDSPEGDYPLNSNSYFLLPPVIIGHETTLSFRNIAIVPPPAFAQVEISNNRRGTFSLLKRYNWNDYAPWQDGIADTEDWREEGIDLSSYIGDTVTIRLKLQVISAPAADGWYLDDILIGEPDTIEPVFTRTIGLRKGWNLISLPLEYGDERTTAIFPGAVAFKFANGYTASDSLDTGYGYWVKCDTVLDVTLTGNPVECDTINVTAGWNMIGSLSYEIYTSEIGSIPEDNIESYFYMYDTLYHVADRLIPGLGYWIKTDKTGMLVMKRQNNNFIKDE
jgi:hypothetical protein